MNGLHGSHNSLKLKKRMDRPNLDEQPANAPRAFNPYNPIANFAPFTLIFRAKPVLKHLGLETPVPKGAIGRAFHQKCNEHVDVRFTNTFHHKPHIAAYITSKVVSDSVERILQPIRESSSEDILYSYKLTGTDSLFGRDSTHLDLVIKVQRSHPEIKAEDAETEAVFQNWFEYHNDMLEYVTSQTGDMMSTYCSFDPWSYSLAGSKLYVRFLSAEAASLHACVVSVGSRSLTLPSTNVLHDPTGITSELSFPQPVQLDFIGSHFTHLFLEEYHGRSNGTTIRAALKSLRFTPNQRPGVSTTFKFAWKTLADAEAFQPLIYYVEPTLEGQEANQGVTGAWNILRPVEPRVIYSNLLTHHRKMSNDAVPTTVHQEVRKDHTLRADHVNNQMLQEYKCQLSKKNKHVVYADHTLLTKVLTNAVVQTTTRMLTWSILNNSDVHNVCIALLPINIALSNEYFMYTFFLKPILWYSTACFRHEHNMSLNGEHEIKKHKTFNFLSQNVATLTRSTADDTNYNDKLDELSNYGHKEPSETGEDLTHLYCHVIFLQESNLTDKHTGTKLALSHKFPYHRPYVCGVKQLILNDKRQGVITLIDIEWAEKISYHESMPGRADFFVFDMPSNKGITKQSFINIYGPTDHNDRVSIDINKTVSAFIKQCSKYSQKGNYPITIIGDWNGVLNPTLDRIPTENTRRGVNPEVSTISASIDILLMDAYRSLYPEVNEFTFKNKSRIDALYVCLTTIRTIQTINHIQLSPVFDHKSVQWTIHLENAPMFSACDNQDNFCFNKDIFRTIHWDEYRAQCLSQETMLLDINKQATTILLDNNKLDAEVWISTQAPKFEQLLLNAALLSLPTKSYKTEEKVKRNPHQSTKKIKTLKQILSEVQWRYKAKLAFTEVICDDINTNISKLQEVVSKQHLNLDHLDPMHIQQWIKNTKRLIDDLLTIIETTRNSRDIKNNIDECYMDRLSDWGTGQFKTTIDSILNRKKERVNISIIVEKHNNLVTRVIDEPEEVRRLTMESMKTWHGLRDTHMNNMSPQWRQEFEPKNYINSNVYEHLMDPPSFDEVREAIYSTKDKAAGLSKLSLNMIKFSSKEHQIFLTNIGAIAFKFGIVPISWTKGLIYPVPKSTVTWDANITNTRPITLLEVPRKLILKVLTKRLSTIILDNNILKGNNPSVLKGTGCDEVIHLINAAMEDARENNKEMWIVLQDMKRAFDSVDNNALVLSMKRLKLPQQYIDLYIFINKQRENCVITGHGNTDFYHPLAGLDQGGVECPLHWRIFYDSLLCFIQSNHQGYQMSHTATDIVSKQQCTQSINITGSAFVDDTWWAAKSIEEMTSITNSAQEFSYIMGINVNPTKTKLIVINESPLTVNQQFLFGNPQQPINRSPSDQGERLLGVYISADGLNKTQREIIYRDVNTFIETLDKKLITDQICIYLINMVLYTALTYRCKLFPLTKPECEKIDKQVTALAKRKSGHAKTLLTEIMHQPMYYNIQKLWDMNCEAAATTYLNRLNGIGPTRVACDIREMSLASRHNVPMHCHNYPYCFKGSRYELIPKLLNMNYYRELTLRNDMLYPELTPLASLLLKQNTYTSMIQNTKKYNIQYLDQFFDKTGTNTLTWQQATKNKKIPTPNWYRDMISTISTICDLNTTENFCIIDAWKPIWRVNPFNTIDIRITTIEPEERRSLRNIERNPTNAYMGYGQLSNGTNTTIDGNKRVKVGHLNTRSRIQLLYKQPLSLNNTNITRNLVQNVITSLYHEFEIHDENNMIAVYTDGSLTGQGTPEVSGGCGIIILKQEDNILLEDNLTDITLLPRVEAYGNLEGNMSSFKTELMGVYIALTILKQNPATRVTIYLDNQGVVLAFPNEMQKSKRTIAKVQSTEYFPIWDAIRKLVNSRTGWVHLAWVKGHADNPGNIRADILANKHGVNSDALSNDFKTPARSELMETIKTVPYIEKRLVEGPIRQTMKQTAIVANAVKYTKSKTFKSIGVKSPFDNNSIGIDNNWNITSKNINSGTKITSSFTTPKISSKRTNMIKVLHGIQPSLTILHRRAPLTYTSETCIRCNTELETNEHIYNCNAAEVERNDIKHQSRGMIYAELKKINPGLNAEDQHLITHSLSAIQALRTNAFNHQEMTDAVTLLIEKTKDTNDIQTNIDQRVNIIDQCNRTTFYTLCQGLAPVAIQTILEKLCFIHTIYSLNHDMRIHKSLKTASKIFTLFTKYITSTATTEIWNKRCEEFVEWEKTIGITPGVKRNLNKRREYEEANNLEQDVIRGTQENRRRKKRGHKDEMEKEEQHLANRHYMRLKDGLEKHNGLATYKKHKFKD